MHTLKQWSCILKQSIFNMSLGACNIQLSLSLVTFARTLQAGRTSKAYCSTLCGMLTHSDRISTMQTLFTLSHLQNMCKWRQPMLGPRSPQHCWMDSENGIEAENSWKGLVQVHYANQWLSPGLCWWMLVVTGSSKPLSTGNMLRI